jgi:hypothetical protein
MCQKEFSDTKKPHKTSLSLPQLWITLAAQQPGGLLKPIHKTP